MAGTPIRVPMFPPIGPLSSCPPVGSISSTFTRRFFFYVHEHILKPISRLYCWYLGIPRDGVIFPLPFGLILKERPRLRQQEGLAMNLARKMGVSAPRFISFAEHLPTYLLGFTSILMTTVPGVPLDQLEEESVDMEIIYEDLGLFWRRCRVSAIRGGTPYAGWTVAKSRVTSYQHPQCHLMPMNNISMNSSGPWVEYTSKTRSTSARQAGQRNFFALPPHAIIFTHGDLNKQNIMIGEDGHISGIVDWELTGRLRHGFRNIGNLRFLLCWRHVLGGKLWTRRFQVASIPRELQVARPSLH